LRILAFVLRARAILTIRPPFTGMLQGSENA
jgi:hypothetical protein